MFRLYKKFFSIQIRSAMQYKASFFLTMLGTFLTALTAYFQFM